MRSGDPFLLGVPREHRLRQRIGRDRTLHGRAAQRHRTALRRDRLVLEALESLNGLSVARAGTDLTPVSVSETSRLSAAQETACRRVRRRVSRYDAPSELRPRGALQELLKTGDVYSSAPAQTTAPFDEAKVRVLKGDLCPRDIEDVAPSHICELLRNSEQCIVRPSAELVDEPPAVDPYWDPLLDPSEPKNRRRLMKFLRELVAAGLVSGRRQRKANVAFFFVRKKNGMLRLIVDARQPNQFHRVPPSSQLASVEKLTSTSLAAATIDPGTGDNLPAVDATPELLGGSVDLRDGYYQFLNKRLASWFRVDIKVQAGELGIGGAGLCISATLLSRTYCSSAPTPPIACCSIRRTRPIFVVAKLSVRPMWTTPMS